MSEFMAHIKTHMASVPIVPIENEVRLDFLRLESLVNNIRFFLGQETGETIPSFVCQWSGCNFQHHDAKTTARHLHMHTFHTRIKSRGQAVLELTGKHIIGMSVSCLHVSVCFPGIPPCKMNPDHRNVLPDLPDPFFCFWEGCDLAGKEFPEAQQYYWHVETHAKEYGSSKDPNAR